MFKIQTPVKREGWGFFTRDSIFYFAREITKAPVRCNMLNADDETTSLKFKVSMTTVQVLQRKKRRFIFDESSENAGEMSDN